MEVLGFTIADGNAPMDQLALNLQLLLRICGGTELPIYLGHPRISHDYALFFHGEDGFGGIYNELNEKYKGEGQSSIVADVNAVDYLVDITKKQPGEITIIALAPLTNLAHALDKDPEFATNTKNVVLLGGSYLG